MKPNRLNSNPRHGERFYPKSSTRSYNIKANKGQQTILTRRVGRNQEPLRLQGSKQMASSFPAYLATGMKRVQRHGSLVFK
jgi:hypothetical protein